VNGRSQRGLTLIELLISMSVLLVAMSIVLTIYDATWDSFRKGESAAEQQQSVRIVLEWLGGELRQAGLNHNPDGDPSRPDEQLEAAFDTAVVFRADFDGRDATLSTTPESALAGDAFDKVTTGNDEIVAYVLAKADGSSTGALTFNADVREAQRDGVVETVSISDVAMVHDDPPYNLYRITLSNDPSDWGSPDFFVREELAYNIGSLQFRYYDATDVQLNAGFDPSTLSDDIGGGDSEADDRARIRRVGFDIVGLARDPDPSWVDRGDFTATRAFHKMELSSEIRMRNAGVSEYDDDYVTPAAFYVP
jgi:prepilin-type N-terminal cleavage/methylation domain-containing protein